MARRALNLYLIKIAATPMIARRIACTHGINSWILTLVCFAPSNVVAEHTPERSLFSKTPQVMVRRVPLLLKWRLATPNVVLKIVNSVSGINQWRSVKAINVRKKGVVLFCASALVSLPHSPLVVGPHVLL
jgi:hypothetical protein